MAHKLPLYLTEIEYTRLISIVSKPIKVLVVVVVNVVQNVLIRKNIGSKNLGQHFLDPKQIFGPKNLGYKKMWPKKLR